jgi:transcriptional regulator with XRE-family HTH domain
MSTIGIRLKEERERLRLSQAVFGELGGVQKQAQLKYEKGDRFPDAEYLAAIAISGVDVVYILTGSKSQSSATTPREVALLDNYRHSPVEVQVGVGKLLAETGKALDRANELSESNAVIDIPETYAPVVTGLSTGTNSHAIHDKDE